MIAIGGGRDVQEGFDGRVLNLARVALVYGLTRTFLSDPEEIAGLSRWPVAIALHDVWAFVGGPRLVEDLKFPDRTILAGAQDGIVHPDEGMQRLWGALRDWPVERVALPLPRNFYDSGTPTLVNALLPTIPLSSAEEGEQIYKQQRIVERNRALAGEAKRLNFARYGAVTCEACKFAHTDTAMFDAHHPTPLAVGKRMTLAEHLIVLCPTCHRRAHRKGRNALDAYSLAELQEWVATGRP